MEKVDVAKMKDITLRFCYAALKFCVRYELGNWAPVILGDLSSLVAWEEKKRQTEKAIFLEKDNKQLMTDYLVALIGHWSSAAPSGWQ